MSRRSPPRPAVGALRPVSRTSHARFGIIVAALLVFAASGIVSGQAGDRIDAAAAVAWPPSTGLLISEVQTGGASASDEFVELYNAGPTPADLGGLELAYASSAGTSATRKAAWSAPLVVAPGAHVLLANAAGAYAAAADLTFSGGLASTGGAVVLRPTGGAPLDSVGWGDATNGFVEGAAAAAPPAASSIERLPGGPGGNGTDTNVNRDDFAVRATPSPQGLGAPPVVLPHPSPTADPTPSPTDTPAASSTPEPSTLEPPPTEPPPTEPPTSEPPVTEPPVTLPPATEPPPSATPSPEPSEPPPATPSPDPTPTPVAEPSPASPSPSPTPTPQPEAMPIAAARALADSSLATVAGSLTTAPGFVESGHEAFVQDGTAGIALHLEGTDWPPLARGQGVLASGVIDTRYGQRVLRVARPSDLVPITAEPPIPARLTTGEAREPWEGSLVSVTGSVTGSASSLSDGFAVEIDDGSGPIKVVAVAASGIQAPDMPRGATMAVTGVLGQRNSTGSGTAGYRLYPRDAADVSRLPDPTPDPGGEPTPTAAPSPTLGPSPSLSPEPNPTPSSDPSPEPSSQPSPTATSSPEPDAPGLAIAEARRLAIGSTVRVTGTVTAERGSVVDARTAVIQDGGAGIAVRLTADQSGLLLDRGLAVRVTGRIAERFGNLEIRLLAGTGLEVQGTAPVPAPRAITAPELGETTEGLLVRADGTVAEISRSGGSTTSFVLDDGHGKIRVSLAAAIRSEFAKLRRGQRVDVAGVAGQRAPRAGSLTGYAIWPRDAEDVVVTEAPTPPAGSPGPGDPTPSPSGGPTGGGATPPAESSPVTVLRARQAVGRTVTIEGTVTTAPGLLDADGRRVIVEDATGGILVRLPAGSPAVRLGDRVRLRGKVGTFERTPQIAVSGAPVIVARGVSRSPRLLTRAPARADDCRLVRVTASVVSIRRYGQSWRAQVRLANRAIVEVQGLARSGIDAGRLAKGATVAVTGVVRHEQGSGGATRPVILPRDPADLKVDGPAGTGTGTAGGAGGQAAGGSSGSPGPSGLVSAAIIEAAAEISGSTVAAGSDGSAPAPDIDLVDLANHTGEVVRAGGLVASVSGTRLVLDDGTASAGVQVAAEQADGLADIREGDAVNVTGRVQAGTAGAPEIAVGPDQALVRVAGPSETRSGPGQEPTADAPAGAGSASDTGAQSRAPAVEVALEAQAAMSPGVGDPPTRFPSGLGILLLVAAIAGGARLAVRRGRGRTRETGRPIDGQPSERLLLEAARVAGTCLDRVRRRSNA